MCKKIKHAAQPKVGAKFRTLILGRGSRIILKRNLKKKNSSSCDWPRFFLQIFNLKFDHLWNYKTAS